MKILIRNRLFWGTTVLMLAAGATYGCKDFLVTPAQGVLNQDVLTTSAGVEGSLIAAYRMLDCSNSVQGPGWGCAASNWVWGNVVSDDAYKGSVANDQPPIEDLEKYLWASGNAESYINEKWSTVYEGTSRANGTIRLLDKVRAEKPGEIDDARAKEIRGEAIFLRAHYQFEAYRMWGNIPYYRSDDSTDFRKANESPSAALADILVDLDSAMALLPDLPHNGDKGRATKWTAEAYKGRVQVYAGDYSGAVATLTDVMNNGPYKLETSFDHVWTAFANYQDGPETILAFQASVRDGDPNADNSNYGERLNFPYSGSHFQCCGPFNPPSQNLVNFFRVDANGLPLALSSSTWNASSTEFSAGSAVAVDPRLDWTVGRSGVPFKDWPTFNYNGAWIRDAVYSGPYSPKKNIHEQAANGEANVGWQPQQQNDVHIHIFRYADLLLLLAEADVQTNNLSGAETLVNMVRARAGQTAQGCGSADSTVLNRYPGAWPAGCTGDTRLAVPLTQGANNIDSLNTPWAHYKIGLYPAGAFTTMGPAGALLAVQVERRLELAMEGQRFFDLRRWGETTLDSTIDNYVATEKTRRAYLQNAAVPLTSRFDWFPIPSIQIDLSKVGTEQRLTQNPGW
jgi:hypothetical protein